MAKISWHPGDAPVDESRGGIGWVLAAVFIIADMAGGGLIALPNALQQGGPYFGIAIIILCALTSGYTGIQLSDNWIILQNRWRHYRSSHCGKPYSEMARRAFGPKARVALNCCLFLTQFGSSTVFMLLAGRNIASILAAILDIHINKCIVILIVALLLWPLTMLKSPMHFWQVAIGSVASTCLAIVLILYGSIRDAPKCLPEASYVPASGLSSISLAYGTIMFAYGGHGTFPTIQHDMRRPRMFARSVWVSYLIILLLMYLPVSIIGYAVYGNSLHDTIISSLQTTWVQQAVNIMITLHVFTVYIIVFSPLTQGVEDLLKIAPHFGWQRILTRTGLHVFVLFVAESVPRFGVFLDLVGGSTITLMTMLLPGVFNLFLVAAEKKREEKRQFPSDQSDEYASLTDVFRLTSGKVLALNAFVLLFGSIGGVCATSSALVNLLGAEMEIPCYIQAFRSAGLAPHSTGIAHCCGAFGNITVDPSKDPATFCLR